MFIGTGQFGGDHHAVRHSDHSKVAGTGFQSCGSMDHVRRSFHEFVKEIAEREVIAWRSFFALRHLLCDTLKHRLRLLSSCVASSMYWCSGSWILTQSQCTHLRAIQDTMLRRMIYVPRRTTETAEAHMIRWSRLLHNCR